MDFNKAIQFEPKWAEAYYFLGLSKISAGQKESGCLDLSKAGELGDEQAYEMIQKYCQ
jgi:hypothetical protein